MSVTSVIGRTYRAGLLVLLLPAWLLLATPSPAMPPAAAGDGLSDPGTLPEQFASPGPAWRGKPFWSWNGKLERDELIRQIHVIKQMGFGGYFMHSRTGLATEYLGDEWFNLINACADEGKKLGLEAWLYDEDRWPSGTAGGLVTENPKYRARFIVLQRLPGAQFHWSDDLVAAFACDLKGLAVSHCQRLRADTPAATFRDRTVLAFNVQEAPRSSFFNGFTDVDRLNREATDCFIRLTHEKYKAKSGDRFGKSILGIFTDEPHRQAVMSVFGGGGADQAPWTAALPGEFSKRFGYDLLDRLPELFLQPDGRAVSPVKWHYMELLQALFLENWARPIHDWCRQNHLLFTGHVLHEDSLSAQATMQGSLMRFYEYEDYPGVDVLTEGNRNYWIVKQLASAARQVGQKRLLSELYGVTGWQFNFESHKYVGDWQALFGINLRCPHLSWYTMAGEAKRDYPASILHQSAWWPEYSYVETYFARLGLVLAQGEPVCDVLVVNPIESVWCQIHSGWAEGLSARTAPVQELEKAYSDLFFWLTRSHVDFDYGDEEMIGRLNQLGRDAAGAPVLRVGKAAYRVVVVPRMTTIRSSTLALLERFRRAGGQVVFAGAPPAFVDAAPSNAPEALAARSARVPWDRARVVEQCRNHLRHDVEIVDPASGRTHDEIFCQLRQDGDRRILVAMSMDREHGQKGAILRVKSPGAVAEWDCTTGQRFAVPSRTVDGWTEWSADFAPLGEHVFVLSRAAEPGLPAKPQFREVERHAVPGPFAYRLNEPNVCVLDLAKFQVNEGQWQPETEVLKVDQAVRRAFKLPLRGGEMVQPWFSKKFEPAPRALGKVEMVFEFAVDEVPSDTVMLGIEKPEDFRIAVNGRAVPAGDGKSWWVDPAIRTLPFPAALLVKGPNRVELQCDFRKDVNIESLYLLGDFGVRLDGSRKTLTRLPDRLAPSDLVAQGLPFYSGWITYQVPVPVQASQGRRLFIETPAFEAACIRVKPAEGPPGMIAWQPYRAAIAGGTVALDVALTRRNSFGPLHLVPKRSDAYGPGHWLTEGAAWSQAYQLYPSGLLEPPVVSVNEIR